jgi:pentose-5-phosphate-3-epimerase
MDGHFVPNITMGAPVLASVHKTVDNVFMDCHMMVADPAKVSLLLSYAVGHGKKGGERLGGV